MGAITGTKVYAGELSGENRLLSLTAPVGSASDTITLTAASHGGVTEIVGIVGAAITGGLDDSFTALQVSFSGLVITVVTLEADGTASDEWTGTTIALTLLIKTTA
jgi:hypothetical protein